MLAHSRIVTPGGGTSPSPSAWPNSCVTTARKIVIWAASDVSGAGSVAWLSVIVAGAFVQVTVTPLKMVDGTLASRTTSVAWDGIVAPSGVASRKGTLNPSVGDQEASACATAES